MNFFTYIVLASISLLGPALFAGISKGLASSHNWQVGVLIFGLLAIYRHGADRIFRGDASPRWSWPTVMTVSLCAYLLSLVFRYLAFRIGGYDYSIFDLMLYNTNSGHESFMYSPICDCNHFHIHLNAILLLIMPFHALFESHFFLLGLHAIVLWLSIFPLRSLARRYLADERLAVLVVLAFLGFGQTGSLLSYAFHPEVFFVPAFLWLIDGYERGKAKIWIPALLVVLLTKEDAGLYAAALWVGDAIFGTRSRRRLSTTLAAVSLAIFIVTVLVIHPAVRSGVTTPINYTSQWSQYGSSLTDSALGMLTHPHWVISDLLTSKWYVLFAGTLLLPLFSLRAVVAMLPALVILATSSSESMRNYGLHYGAPLLPLVFWGLLDGYSNLRRRFPGSRRLPQVLVAALLLAPVVGAGAIRYYPPQSAALQDLASVRDAFIQGAQSTDERVYCVQTALIPHMPYGAKVRKLSDSCLQQTNAIGITNPTLSPYPDTHEAIAVWMKQFGAQQDVLPGGTIVFSKG